MTSINITREERRLYDIAQDYERRGYTVTVSPSPKRLPKFLSKFRPDIVAEGPNESVVVEVKSPNKVRGIDYWRELNSIVKQHPGWRIELVINDQSSNKRPKSINKESINERLQQGQQLAQQGMLSASLLITWAAAEASMRFASKNHEVELPDFRPATLITRLYSDGLLARNEYDFLIRCMRITDAIAHGFHEGQIRQGMLKRLRLLALRLLE